MNNLYDRGGAKQQNLEDYKKVWIESQIGDKRREVECLRNGLETGGGVERVEEAAGDRNRAVESFWDLSQFTG